MSTSPPNAAKNEPGASPPSRRVRRGAVVWIAVAGLALFGLAAVHVAQEAQERAWEASEPVRLLDLIKKQARTYYTDPGTLSRPDPRAPGEKVRVPCQYPANIDWSPPGRSCCDAAVDGDRDGRCDLGSSAWSHPVWKALRFAPSEPHRYQYRFQSTGTLAAARWTAEARADLDCDGLHEETYETGGRGDSKATLSECDSPEQSVRSVRRTGGDE